MVGGWYRHDDDAKKLRKVRQRWSRVGKQGDFVVDVAKFTLFISKSNFGLRVDFLSFELNFLYNSPYRTPL